MDSTIQRLLYNVYLSSTVFKAHVLVGPCQELKQITQTEHNRIPTEANQLAIYKRGRGFELVTEKHIQVGARAGLEPWTAELRVQHADLSASLPLQLLL